MEPSQELELAEEAEDFLESDTVDVIENIAVSYWRNGSGTGKERIKS